MTVAPVVAERPVAELQLKLFAPLAVRLVLPPEQIARVPLTVMTGTPFTVTVTWAESVHPRAVVPATV